MAVMTGLAAFAVLWPLARRQWPDLDDLADARSLYRAQLSDIQRDKSRGLIDDVQAQGAEVEAARRLLRAGAEDVAGKLVDPSQALRRRRLTSIVALLGLPLVGLGVYGMHGVPSLPSLPLAARLSTNPANLDVNVAVARIEAHLALNPADGRGWDVVAPVYFRLQRYEDAAKAYRAAIQHAGPSQERFAGLGDALTQGAQGMVTACWKASRACAAICAGVTGTGCCCGLVSTPVRAQVMMALSVFMALSPVLSIRHRRPPHL